MAPALTAAGAVRRDIAAGCELVVLSKFGKLEAAGEGLAPAFKAALDARLPLLTSVSPLWKTPGSDSSADRSSFSPPSRPRSTRGGRPFGRRTGADTTRPSRAATRAIGRPLKSIAVFASLARA
jgi:hypothetical protein